MERFVRFLPIALRDRFIAGCCFGVDQPFFAASHTPHFRLLSYRECNVEAESRDAASLLVVYRELLGLRKAHSALNFGGYRPVPAECDLLLYIRHMREERLLVALNLGGTPAEFPWRRPHSAAQLLYSTTPGRAVGVRSGHLALAPHEGIILSLDGE